MKKRKFCFFLAVLTIFMLLFPVASVAEEEDIPTIFIGNEAWYKSSLLPLITINDEFLVPISVFLSFEHLSLNFSDEYSCYIIERNDGDFISISAENGRFFSGGSNRGSIQIHKGKNELYISAKTVSDILGLEFEHAVFYDKDIVRIYYNENVLPLEILIDYYITSASSFVGSAGVGGVAIRRDIFSFFTDLSEKSTAEINELLDIINDYGISMTFAMSLDFISQKKNSEFITDLASTGHTFAVSIDEKSDIRPIDQAALFNDKLYNLVKKKTLIALSSAEKNELRSKGFILLNDGFRISNLNDNANINFNINSSIFFDRINSENIIKFKNIVTGAKSNGRTVTAINALAGN